VLRLMNKGVRRDRALSMLRAIAEAGIHVHLFILFGFPGEQAEDAEQTLSFLEEVAGFVQSVGASTFKLCLRSPIASAPERFGLRPLPGPEIRFSGTLDFVYADNDERTRRRNEEMVLRTRELMERRRAWRVMSPPHMSWRLARLHLARIAQSAKTRHIWAEAADQRSSGSRRCRKRVP
jgi:hypothetical protein